MNLRRRSITSELRLLVRPLLNLVLHELARGGTRTYGLVSTSVDTGTRVGSFTTSSRRVVRGTRRCGELFQAPTHSQRCLPSSGRPPRLFTPAFGDSFGSRAEAAA